MRAIPKVFFLVSIDITRYKLQSCKGRRIDENDKKKEGKGNEERKQRQANQPNRQKESRTNMERERWGEKSSAERKENKLIDICHIFLIDSFLSFPSRFYSFFSLSNIK